MKSVHRTADVRKKDLEIVKRLEATIPLKVSHLSEKQWKIFYELFTYNTNAIEGSKLNSKEVRDILEKDKWPDKSKSDIAEAYGVNEAIEFIREIHKIVFKNSKSFAGELRKPNQEVIVADSLGNVVHEGAPQVRVIALLNELVEWYNNHKNKYPALVLAAVIHNQFENIHPFQDGNGRVGRLLLNNILIKHKFPPVNIGLTNRTEYYRTLQEYENKGNIRPTLELIIKEYKILKKELKK